MALTRLGLALVLKALGRTAEARAAIDRLEQTPGVDQAWVTERVAGLRSKLGSG